MSKELEQLAEEARKRYRGPWILWGECLDLCRLFGFNKPNFLGMKHRITTNKPERGWTRYSREDVIRELTRKSPHA